jgi:ribosomal 30S subunit maturation factor RimM
MKKFNVQDIVFLNEAIYAFLNEAEKFEKESKLLGKQPIITHSYWKMMAKDVIKKVKNFSTKKANKELENYEQQMSKI